MRKAAILAGLWTILVCATAQTVQMTPYLEREPNSSLSAPQVIDTPVSQPRGFVVWEAQLDTVGDRDFYQFRITQAGTYSIRVDTNLDTVLRLYDANGVLIADNDNGGNPDVPLNRFAPGLTRDLIPGTYIVEVFYWQNLARARYALRVFPGITAPDYDPTEPNNTEAQSIYLGRLSGGELITSDYRFLSYGGGDVDVYRFTLDSTGQTLKVRTQTYVDTVLHVITPNGQIYVSDDSEWDILNFGASEVRINLAPRGTYYVYVRSNPAWGGYYRLRVSAPLPSEIFLQDGNTTFNLRGLRGDRTRNPFNNADWTLNGRDQFYQMGWWYRVRDIHTREFTLSNLTYYDQERPNRAILSYLEPDGLTITAQYELKRTFDGGSVLYADLVVINSHPQPRTVHIFHYSDLDVSGVTTNLANWDSERIRVATTLDQVWLAAQATYTRWQVDAFPQVIDRLLDTEPTELTNGTLPLEGDFAGALQWTLSMQPFEYRLVRVAYTLNTTLAARRADVNRDGCVDDSDLLNVLFEFRNEGLLLDADVNGDSVVDDADLLEVLFYFRSGCR
ncbi:MAG: pre-peptidase C-terminal domain-containing protein [Fimbriimonadales bacterium]|nr:pre-peptidase C-terminal domain-containing protein [Fimbriimonadales bacterium]